MENFKWKDQVWEHPRRYKLQQNADGTVDVIPEKGKSIQEGTPVNAKNLNQILDDIDNHKRKQASDSELGHVKAGDNITIDADGTINAKGGNVDSVNSKTGKVVLNASDINAVPTNRTISSGTGLIGGGDLSSNRQLSVDFGTGSNKVARGNHTHSQYQEKIDPTFGEYEAEIESANNWSSWKTITYAYGTLAFVSIEEAGYIIMDMVNDKYLFVLNDDGESRGSVRSLPCNLYSSKKYFSIDIDTVSSGRGIRYRIIGENGRYDFSTSIGYMII